MQQDAQIFFAIRLTKSFFLCHVREFVHDLRDYIRHAAILSKDLFFSLFFKIGALNTIQTIFTEQVEEKITYFPPALHAKKTSFFKF